MAGTTFSEIYDNFMQLVTDYRLVDLYNASATDFETYLSAWLLNAITDFSNCDQSLANSSSSFTETLTQKNIKMLAFLMKKYWMIKEINDITQMNLHITDKDFKMYSESQNIREKQAKYYAEVEEISQMLEEYSLKNNPAWIDQWLTGNFYIP